MMRANNIKLQGGAVKRTFLLVFLISLANAACADSSTTAKKYPPYLDVWGYELPYPSKGNRFSQITPYQLNDNDIFFTYVGKWSEKKRKSNSGYNVNVQMNGFSFFAQEKKYFTKEEYNEFGRQNRKLRFRPNSWQKIPFNDGTYIKQNSTDGGNCYSPYHYFLEKRNKQDKIIARKTLFYLLKEPKKIGLQPSCGAQGGVLERVSAGPLKVIALADDTFLVYEYKGNYILRVDKDFHTKYPINQALFLVDTDIVDAIRKKARAKYPDNVDNDKYFQYINDAVHKHVINLR